MGVGRSFVVCLVPALALAPAACHREAAPADVVIAKVGTEKVTEAEFREMVRVLIDDEGRADELLNMEEHRGQRNEFLSRFVDAKRIGMLAREEGLDGDARVRLQIEEETTQVYFQTLLNRRLDKLEPTEAQLRDTYNELSAAQKAKGITVPPFEEAKPYLPQLWLRKRQGEAAGSLEKEYRQKYPATYADGYKSLSDGQ